jgi:hypothetical protein
MSAFGPKRTCASAPHMSALGVKADMTLCGNPLSRGVKRTCSFKAATRICDPKLFFSTQSTSVTWVTAQDTRSDYFILEVHGVGASQGVVDQNARIVRATPHESPARVAPDMSAFGGKADKRGSATFNARAGTVRFQSLRLPLLSRIFVVHH